ncbi:MAG: hypothetical protein ACOX6T_10250 [Myxococcales bacterium]|jgi:hypothetical protein
MLAMASRLMLTAATLTALLYLGLALEAARGERLRLGRALVPAAAAGLAALVPAGAFGLLPVAAALVCVLVSLLLGWLAWRAFARYRAAQAEARATVARALELFGEEGAVMVSVRGKLVGDPPLIAPLSGKPCLGFRLEVLRGRGAEADLVYLDLGRAERLVLRDEGGQVALARVARLFRGLAQSESRLEGEVDAKELLERPAPKRPIARRARELDPDPPLAGLHHYRFIEHLLPDQAPAKIAGVLSRAAGEPMLEPWEVRPGPERQGGNPRRLLKMAARHAAAAAALAFAGWLWLLAGS